MNFGKKSDLYIRMIFVAYIYPSLHFIHERLSFTIYAIIPNIIGTVCTYGHYWDSMHLRSLLIQCAPTVMHYWDSMQLRSLLGQCASTVIIGTVCTVHLRSLVLAIEIEKKCPDKDGIAQLGVEKGETILHDRVG